MRYNPAVSNDVSNHHSVHELTTFLLSRFNRSTNLPLNIVEVFDFFEGHALAVRFAVLNDACRAVFALSFFAIRLVAWPIYSYSFWVGSLALLESGRAHSRFAVAFILAANLFLTALQLIWGRRIGGLVWSALTAKPSTEPLASPAAVDAASGRPKRQ